MLVHATVPVSQVQKRELMVTPGSSAGLFDQSLLERVASQVKEDAFISFFHVHGEAGPVWVFG